MMRRNTPFVLLICLTLCAEESAALKKYSPRDVEVRMRDGSCLRGELKGIDALILKTDYGTLTVPLANMLRLRAGHRAPPLDAPEISAAIKDLDNDDFARRAAAQQKLEAFGAAAAGLLKEALKTASTEGRSRIDGLLRNIASRKSSVSDDVVKTDEFEAQGTLQPGALTVATRIGDLQVKLEDLESVRWLAHGNMKTIPIEANSGLKGWTDTGIDTSPGERVAVVCCGTITLFDSNVSGPGGATNLGNRDGTFLPGTMIGRLGEGGTPFLIGNRKVWIATAKERLYVKIFCAPELLANNENAASQGEFTLHIGSGWYVDELPRADASSALPTTRNSMPIQLDEQEKL